MGPDLTEVDRNKERILRWRLEQQQQQKQQQKSQQQQSQQEQLVDENEDPLDQYMSTLNTQHTSTHTPFDLDLDEIQPPITQTLLDLDSQDVIGNASKRPKTLDQIPTGTCYSTEPFRKIFLANNPETTINDKLSTTKQGESVGGGERIKIKGKNIPSSISKWEQCGVSSKVLHLLKNTLGFQTPTPIQSYAISAIMSGRDLIGVAKTGSGKTLAYAVPLLRHVLDQRPVGYGEGPIGLVLVPTRELALQVLGEVKKFSAGTRIRSIACYGGPPIKEQIGELKRGAEIIVSTPGRMIDLLCANSGKVVNLNRVTFLALDEADRMFDAGFEPQVMRMIDCTRPDRQTVMFSATFPRAMEALARRILTDPLEITILPGSGAGKYVVCEDVEQRIVVVEEEDKFPRLLQILGEYAYQHGINARVLIFVERQEGADHLLRDLLRKGYPCSSLHGGKDQADRDCTIADFKQGVIPMLIATSVAARGLDVQGLGLVINYDCPNHVEDYVHRVGRTGRAGKKGIAYTLITPEQSKYAVEVSKALKASNVPVPQEMEKLYHGDKHSSLQAQTGGFGGKGLDRLDSDREMVRGAQKAAFYSQMIDSTGGETPLQETQPSSQASDKLPARMRESWDSPFTKPLQAAVGKIVQRLISIGVAPKTGVFELTDPVRTLNERFGFSSDPASGDIVPIPEGNAAALSVRGEKMSYCCEVLINSYPQQARWKVTSRDNLNAITLATETAITVRGTYVPPGKNDSENERKLYLYIEGETKESVQSARDEVRRILASEK